MSDPKRLNNLVPKLGLSSSKGKRKRVSRRLGSNGNELELWKKFIEDEECHGIYNCVSTCQDPNLFPSGRTDKREPSECEYTSDTSESESKSQQPIGEDGERINTLRKKKIDLSSYNKWKDDIFDRILQHTPLSEESKTYFTERREQISQDLLEKEIGQDDFIKFPSFLNDIHNRQPNAKVTYNPLLLSKGASGNDSIRGRKHVSGSHLDIKRLEFEMSQQEQHMRIQEEARRMSQGAPPGSLTPQVSRGRTVLLPSTEKSRVKKSISQKSLLRRASGSEEEKLLSVPLSLPATPPTRSKISRNSSSSSLLGEMLSPTSKSKYSDPTIKSPKREGAKKKALKSIIKSIEKGVQSPRARGKKMEKRSTNLLLDIPVEGMAVGQVEEETLDDSLSSFILSPKSKNSSSSVRTRKGAKKIGNKSANRSKSMSLSSKNNSLQIESQSGRSDSDGDGVLSAPETTFSSVCLDTMNAELEEEQDDVMSD